MLVFSVLLCQSQNTLIKCGSPKDEGLIRTTAFWLYLTDQTEMQENAAKMLQHATYRHKEW